MRIIISAIAILLYQTMCLGQTTNYTFKFALPANGTIEKMLWADIDNDSLLDVVIGYKDQSNYKVAVFINKINESWPIHTLVSTPYSDQISFVIHDINKDAKKDVIILNETSLLVQYYINNSNLDFAQGEGWGSREVFIKGLQFADMNNDALEEIIWTDGGTLSILNHQDTSLLKIQSFQALDIDLNGFRDLIFSGIDNNSKPLTYAWYFGDNFRIINRTKVADASGQITTGDLNHDGYFDIIISGKDVNTNLKTQLYINNKTSFSPSELYPAIDSSIITIADLDSDGLADVSLFGIDANGNPVNQIQFNNYSSTLPVVGVHHQAFGDYDRDGDLDFAQITNSLEITNSNPGLSNKGPSGPTHGLGLQVFNRMFFYWDKPGDDHSPMHSITYDLKVFTPDSVILASDFDSETKHRLVVSHGNMGTNNFSLQKIQGNFNFEVQAIDNAFVPNVKSICHGICSGCISIDQQNIAACNQTPVILTSPAPQALWFSFKKGFVGIEDEYAFAVAESDTVFSFNPSSSASCASLRVFNIVASPTDTVKLSHTRFNCMGRNITLEVATEWSGVTWKNNLNSSVAAAQSIVHHFEKEIQFTAFASNDYGCQLKEKFLLKVSKPNLQVNGTQFQVMRGNGVQLVATGGNLYDWKPASSLNDNQIANPVASPNQTTEYTVTAYDTLGCSEEAKILVEVFEEAFIPTLFTPNEDGQNDNLKIYGLTQASGFRFAIYNREGSKLFETTNVNEASSIGWTGAVNGTKQPPGTYYWKVEGNAPNGELLLNGKKSGVILLLR